jgi:hypothetical protein
MLKRILRAMLLTISLATPIFAEWSPHSRLSERKSTTIYVASVQFPSIIKELPKMRAYFGGRKVVCETDGDRLVFTIETDRSMRKLYLLIVEDHSFKFDETIRYLKIKPNTDYKLWSLELIHKKNTEVVAPKLVGGIKLDTDEKSPYYWIIREEILDGTTGQIPDNTIILRYNPNFVDHLEESRSSVDLPRIVIASDILKKVGSEANLHELSTRYLLSALECDTIHGRDNYVISRPTANCITITTT